MVGHHVQQQQQHSLFCQASWGRLEMKPKRNKGHSSGTCTFQKIKTAMQTAPNDCHKMCNR